MNDLHFPALLLRLRLALAARGPLVCGALLLAVLGASALLWLLPQRGLQARRQAVALVQAARPAPPPVGSAPAPADENLALFYATLGEQRYAEQQVKTLFGIAAKLGLTLSQGQYKAGLDRNGRMATYQVLLPVKGSYDALWQFCLMALRAIPFAALDEISFKRDTVGDVNVEAHLRLTLYLAAPPGAATEGAP